MKRTLFLFAIIMMATIAASSQDKKGNSNDTSIAIVGESTHDFGDIKEADGPVSYTFKVKNEGKSPLVITKVQASCGCTTPNWTKEPIAPGKTGNINVTYDVNGRPGQFTKTISVYSNGKVGSLVLTIKGKVIPKNDSAK